MVAVDGGNSFFVNAPGGRYEDLVTKDLVAHVESTYRVVPGRKGRALLGVSMGGYAALHVAFEQPGLVAAVATHSAMLLERIPSADQGAGRWHMAAFNKVFGDPIDPALWAESDPLAWARKVDPKAVAGALRRLRCRGPVRPRQRPPRAARDPRRARRRTRLRAATGRPRLRLRPRAAREEPALPRRAPAPVRAPRPAGPGSRVMYLRGHQTLTGGRTCRSTRRSGTG